MTLDTMAFDKQKRFQLNKNEAILLFAQFIASVDQKPVELYLQDLKLLDMRIEEHKQHIPWDEFSSKLGVDRWKIYHWYFETLQRSLEGPMEKDDQKIMKLMIEDAMQRNLPMDKELQNKIKFHLSKKYHRSSFSIAFNNIRRQLKINTRHIEDGSDSSFIPPASSNSSIGSFVNEYSDSYANTAAFEMKTAQQKQYRIGKTQSSGQLIQKPTAQNNLTAFQHNLSFSNQQYAKISPSLKMGAPQMNFQPQILYQPPPMINTTDTSIYLQQSQCPNQQPPQYQMDQIDIDYLQFDEQ